MNVSIESIRLMRDQANENIKKIAEQSGTTTKEVSLFIDEEIDFYNLLIPSEYYRRRYNKSTELLSQI